jgi:hypothetical protein
VPDVADGEHTGCAGFEQVGFPRPGPAFSQVRAGQDVAPLVAPDRLRKPAGVRLRADQDEQGIGVLCLAGTLLNTVTRVRWLAPGAAG